jgi:hypothetical protein
MPHKESMDSLAREQFKADAWYLIRRLRDMKKAAEEYGVYDKILSAQVQLAAAMGQLDSEDYSWTTQQKQT